MMAWIPVHQSLADHRKTRKLCRLLKISRPAAIGHLVLFWLWSIDNLPDGYMAGVDADELAEVMRYEGEPNDLYPALIESGFCDEDPLRLHDFLDYTGKLLDQRLRHAEAQREYRDRRRDGHVTDTRQSRDALENSTNSLYKQKKSISTGCDEGNGMATWDGPGDPESAAVWLDALEEVRKKVSLPNYRSWFAKTEGLSRSDGHFTIGVPNKFIADYLEKNQCSLIGDVLRSVLKIKAGGEAPKVEYVLLPKKKEAAIAEG